MNPEPKRGERRADGKYFLGFGGLEWVTRQVFRDAANAQLRASGRQSREWRAAVNLFDKIDRQNADAAQREKRRACQQKSYYSVSLATRREKARAGAERTKIRVQKFNLEARAYLAAKKKAREETP